LPAAIAASGLESASSATSHETVARFTYVQPTLFVLL
jgi:hypothetical protein